MDIKKYRKEAYDLIASFRQNYNTTALIDTMKRCDAYLIVGSFDHCQRIVRNHPELKSRVFSISQIEKLRGLPKAPLLFDNEVIAQLCYEPNPDEISADTIKQAISDPNYKKFTNDLVTIEKLTETADGGFSYLVNSFVNPEAVKSLTSSISKEPFKQQLNVKLTEADVQELAEINDSFFEGEATNSMIGRLVLRKGIAAYKKLKEIL